MVPGSGNFRKLTEGQTESPRGSLSTATAIVLTLWGCLCWELIRQHLSGLISKRSYHKREGSTAANEKEGTVRAMGPCRESANWTLLPSGKGPILSHNEVLTHNHSLPPSPPWKWKQLHTWWWLWGQEPDPNAQGYPVGFRTQERDFFPNN